MPCEKCTHTEHTGLCGLDYQIQYVTTTCACVIAMPENIDLRTLRRKDADQQRRLKELQAKDRSPYQPPLKWRKMKPIRAPRPRRDRDLPH